MTCKDKQLRFRTNRFTVRRSVQTAVGPIVVACDVVMTIL